MRRRTADSADFGRVAVLMGGWSGERDVSLWSGQNVLAALRAREVDAQGVDVDRDVLLRFGEAGFDRAFNVLHGPVGEDGTVQALLDLLEIPYTGCGVLGSALAMDKVATKRIWRAEGLPTPDFLLLADESQAAAADQRLGLPLFVKPVVEGSSLGVVKVKRADELISAYRQARGAHARSIMVERAVDGGEYTCAILDGEALPLVRIEPAAEFYDYQAKYLSDQTVYRCPAGLDPERESYLAALCVRAFELIGGRGWGRVDFMLDGDGEPWLIEANTNPGMTAHSLVPMAARAAGLDFEDLCWAILETSLALGGQR